MPTVPPVPPESAAIDRTLAPPTPDACPAPVNPTRSFPAQVVLAGLGVIAFLYFARPVALPVFLACMAGMTLKPLIGQLARFHLPKGVAAAGVVGLIVAAITLGFFQLGHPASAWVNDAPQHMTELRQRVQKLFPQMGHFTEAAAAVSDLGATPEEKRVTQKKSSAVEVKVTDTHGTDSILNWTGALLVGVGETLVLLYLLLASGDLFTQKLVHIMPTWRDKKRAVEINREIQQNISHYLLSVTLINFALGGVTAAGLYFMDVPNAAMWGVAAALLNYVPYFGPVVGVVLLGAVGLLTFDTLPHELLPPAWYLLLHLLESNFVTPILLGRRFSLNPVVIFVSLMFWTWLWGVPGALLSVPILVSLKVVCDRVPRLAPLSELLEK
jgi:predicted PurR-regulated permease PerM